MRRMGTALKPFGVRDRHRRQRNVVDAEGRLGALRALRPAPSHRSTRLRSGSPRPLNSVVILRASYSLRTMYATRTVYSEQGAAMTTAVVAEGLEKRFKATQALAS